MISLRRNFLSKIILLVIVFILCIFYIRSLSNFNALSADRTKFSNVPQQQRLVQLDADSLDQQIQEPQDNQIELVNESSNVGEERTAAAGEGEKTKTNSKINKYELEIQRDLKKQQEIPNLGANGAIAHLRDPDDVAQGEKQLAKIALNEELSNHISYNRSIPDARHPSCRKKSYDISSLPTTTVIIIFFNEPYSVLVRTIHSVINTSPESLLKEIIVVDDGSSNVELKKKLDYYVETRFNEKVKVLRLKNR
jgi:hypothetical protein